MTVSPVPASIFISVLLLLWCWYAHFTSKNVYLPDTELSKSFQMYVAPFRCQEILPEDHPDCGGPQFFLQESWLISFDFDIHRSASNYFKYQLICKKVQSNLSNLSVCKLLTLKEVRKNDLNIILADEKQEKFSLMCCQTVTQFTQYM